MKLRSVVLAAVAGLMMSATANAAVIAAKKVTLGENLKALIMLSDERYTCDGDPDGRFATMVVAMDGVNAPSKTYKACYNKVDDTLLIIFWDPMTNDPRDAGTLDLDQAWFEKTPQFKNWDFIRTSTTPQQ